MAMPDLAPSLFITLAIFLGFLSGILDTQIHVMRINFRSKNGEGLRGRVCRAVFVIVQVHMQRNSESATNASAQFGQQLSQTPLPPPAFPSNQGSPTWLLCPPVK